MTKKQIRIHKKARNRGSVSVEWHKSNDLTFETQTEFRALMKQADKDFDARNPKG